jgi:2-keto-4-pentenoate hydratase/2-oxohepta-3-ene-1,7-dioic acid hydratase in catechol pathway
MADPVPTLRVTYRPVVERPGKILCIGLNYRQHAAETGQPLPTTPVVFGKFNNTLAAHRDPIPIPPAAHKMDYEAELAIVIGKRCYRVTEDDALAHVFGYTLANDVSARDLQTTTSQWLIGKSLDRFCPVGAVLVTADEIPNPNALDIGLRLNGEVRQAANTEDMIFNCREIIAYLSSLMSLLPGDLILTGTMHGVIAGRPPADQQWLKAGDETEVYSPTLGTLTNRFA